MAGMLAGLPEGEGCRWAALPRLRVPVMAL